MDLPAPCAGFCFLVDAGGFRADDLVMQIPRRKSDQFKKRDDGPVYLTEAGFKDLQEQLARESF